MTDEKARVAKVLVVGDVATGKTSAIQRYVKNVFSKDYQTTIGVDFALKKVHANGLDINVQLWDIAGQERFSGLSRIFYTHAVAAVAVYDLFNRESFESTAKWKRDIDAKVFLPVSQTNIPVLLLGNKCDMVSEGQTPCASDGEIEEFVKEHKFFAHYKCSAKTGENIVAACTELVNRIAQDTLREQQAEKESRDASSAPTESTTKTIKVGQEPEQGDKKKEGCCS